MNDDLFYELTTKFLSRELTRQEKDELTIFLQVESYKAKFEKIVSDWENDTWKGEKFDVNDGLERLTEILAAREPGFYWGENIKRKKSLFLSPSFMKAAASILFIVGLSMFALYRAGIFEGRQKTVNEWIEKANQMGEKSQIAMTDGSSIILNADSRIKYPRQFRKENREVYLEGEAYFSIARDTARPFIVHAGGITTTVLGTKFNVASYPGDAVVTVALAEGKVKVTEKNNDMNFEPVILKPDEKMVYNKASKTGAVVICDIQQETGWKDNLLKFKNEPLSNVVVKLERTFGIKFEFSDKSYYKQKITTNFQNATIWSICEVLKKLTGLPYKAIKENNEIKRIVFNKIQKK